MTSSCREGAPMTGISKRVQGFTESVIREMTRVSAQHGGINLAQGMPNFPPPRELVEAAHRALDGDFHQYAITWGTPRFRRAVADKYRRFYGMELDPDQHVTVCCGSTETMIATLLAVLNPGDEVIVFEPFYENYGPGCIIAGAEPVFVPLEPPDFSFDPERLARAVSPRTRAIIFNSPNNPSGKVFSRAELETIADLCLEHDLLAITDEIYEHIVYDGEGHTPIATLPGMAERTVTISGISKSYSVTGWRIGYAVASPELSLGIRRAHDFITVGAPHPLQEAAVTALGFPDSYYLRLRESYQARRDLLFSQVEAAGFVAWKPKGAYYILTDVAHFMKQHGCEDDTAFAMFLVKEIGVATVPGSSFYAHPDLGRTKIRFCFPKTDDMLVEAGRRLQKLAR
ncbi:MAG: aminotransferase [Candidatus Rokubacteria bacterium GWC2_70_16]|nr:MAG: aminotransferase [Candidatus Rokubacteria bacterium GWC2_70_16]